MTLEGTPTPQEVYCVMGVMGSPDYRREASQR